MACRRASWPTIRSPSSVNATTEGVVREPSAFGITVGCPPSTAAMTEFVVPRSMPTAFAIVGVLSDTANRRNVLAPQRATLRSAVAAASGSRPTLQRDTTRSRRSATDVVVAHDGGYE